MRVAVTGARGRLGGALLRTLGEDAVAWSRDDFDLDRPLGAIAALDRDQPDVVIHAAAWTDVDGCAREPERALQRNGVATGRLATACAREGIHLVLISTNEVFDGLRTDGQPYGPDDPPSPPNPYGMSKLAGETAARNAFASGSAHLAVVRTAWLFGPPGRDFPDKILDAAQRAATAGTALQLVDDEIGNPTSVDDLAAAIAALVAAGVPSRTHHIVNQGEASRATWAREVMRLARFPEVETADVPGSTWPRASTPPPRATLLPTPLPVGATAMPTWEAATAVYIPTLLGLRALRQPVSA